MGGLDQAGGMPEPGGGDLDLRIENHAPGGDTVAAIGRKPFDSISGVPAPDTAVPEVFEEPAATVEAPAKKVVAPEVPPAPEPVAVKVEVAPAAEPLEPVYEPADFAAVPPAGATAEPELTHEAQRLHVAGRVEAVQAGTPGAPEELEGVVFGSNDGVGAEDSPGDGPIGGAGTVEKKPAAVAAAPVAEAPAGEAAAEEVSPVGGLPIGPGGIEDGTVEKKPAALAAAPVAEALIAPSVPGPVAEEGVYPFPKPKYVAPPAPATPSSEVGLEGAQVITAPTAPAAKVAEEGVTELNPPYVESATSAEMTPEQAKAEIDRLWNEVIKPQDMIAEDAQLDIDRIFTQGGRVPDELSGKRIAAQTASAKALVRTIELEEIARKGQEGNVTNNQAG